MSRGQRAGWLAAISGAGLLSAAAARGETLADAIALAYQSNPTLQGQRAAQRALDETYVQAHAGYEPTAGIQATITRDNNNESFNQATLPGTTDTSQAALTVTQPIYTGGL